MVASVAGLAVALYVLAQVGRNDGTAGLIAAVLTFSVVRAGVSRLMSLRRARSQSNGEVRTADSVDASPEKTVGQAPNLSISVEYATPHPGRRRAKADVSPEGVWVPPGKPTTVRGSELPDGMLYVGEGLAAVGGHRDLEPALIDPKLPADATDADTEAGLLPYWPCYSDITAECRGA